MGSGELDRQVPSLPTLLQQQTFSVSIPTSLKTILSP